MDIFLCLYKSCDEIDVFPYILLGRTQEALKSGHFISVLHVLMQLQRICNHPDLINPRLSSTSYVSEMLEYRTASLVLSALERDIWKVSGIVNSSLSALEKYQYLCRSLRN